MFEFNPLSPEFQADPYPYYEMLRANMPILYWEQWGIWFITRYEDCVAVLKDNRFGHEILNHMSREEMNLPEPDPQFAPLIEMNQGWMLFRDPPTHTRLRNLVHKAFTPRMVEQLRGRIQNVTDGLLDAVEAKGQMDVVSDLAVPLPVVVIAEMLGVPTSDRDVFRNWSRDLAGTLEMTDAAEVYQRGTKAVISFSAYLRDLADERRKAPKEDLMTALVEAEEQGDKLTEQELISTCILLLVAGHETTTNLIGNGMLALLRNPEQMNKLKADPSLIRPAIEELLRYDSPVQLTSRIALEDVEFKGHHIRKGSEVSTLLGAANRDSEQFKNADRVDITREQNPHLAFSNGIHYCLGAPLARLEGQIAINTLLCRMPQAKLMSENPPYRETFVLRGLKALPLSF